ncbi:glycosyltransferase [bacterium]|nr:glycosyltransferase [bacterium]
MEKKKNIVFLLHSYHSFQKDFVESMAENFENVYVFVRYKPFAEIYNIIPIKQLLKHRKEFVVQEFDKPSNVHIFLVPLWYLPMSIFYRVLGDWHFKVVDKIIRKEKIKFDIIHSHFTWTAGYVGAKLKEKYNKPFVLTVHEDKHYLEEEMSNTNKKISYTWENADQIIRVNKESIKDLKKYNENVMFLSNGFNSGLFIPKSLFEARKELKIGQKQKVLLTVGYLEKYKGHIHLVRAMKVLRDKYSMGNLKLFLIGDGTQRDVLEAETKKLGLSDNIEFLGARFHKDVPIWMNACDLFVLPSLSESFGIVQLEAFACGKPVVATKNSGSLEVIRSDEYGLLCNIADPEDLAEKIFEALNRKWDIKEILRYVKEFGWDKIAKDTFEIYEQLF